MPYEYTFAFYSYPISRKLHLPPHTKKATILLLLKKYRQIPNLTFVSTTIERVVCTQIVSHMTQTICMNIISWHTHVTTTQKLQLVTSRLNTCNALLYGRTIS